MNRRPGRPPRPFNVTLLPEGKSDVYSRSLRGQILAYLKSLSRPTCDIRELEQRFGVSARGAVHKLVSMGWLKKRSPS